MQLFAVPGRYRAIFEQEGWVIIPGCLSPWTGAIDQAPSPLTITGYLAQLDLSFQEADDLYEWAVAALREDATSCDANPNITTGLVVMDTASEGPRWSLEYYQERAAQAELLLDFQDIESLPSDTISLLGVNKVAGYIPTPKQKKKRRSCCKMMATDDDKSYSSWGKESWKSDEDPGPLWNPKGDQMDIDNSGPSGM